MIVNNEIQDYQVKYQDLTDELKSLQGLLVLKNQRLAEEELNLKWFKIREDVLTQKKTELSSRKENLFQQKVRFGFNKLNNSLSLEFTLFKRLPENHRLTNNNNTDITMT